MKVYCYKFKFKKIVNGLEENWYTRGIGVYKDFEELEFGTENSLVKDDDGYVKNSMKLDFKDSIEVSDVIKEANNKMNGVENKKVEESELIVNFSNKIKKLK